jgi:hypothetical protein
MCLIRKKLQCESLMDTGFSEEGILAIFEDSFISRPQQLYWAIVCALAAWSMSRSTHRDRSLPVKSRQSEVCAMHRQLNGPDK